MPVNQKNEPQCKHSWIQDAPIKVCYHCGYKPQNEPLCSLEETIGVCLDNPEFMREYKRLSGASLGFGSPITMMIDKATGYDEVEAKALYEFIRDYIWKPVIAQVVMEQVKEQNAQ